MSFERDCYMSLSFYSENSLETCWFFTKKLYYKNRMFKWMLTYNLKETMIRNRKYETDITCVVGTESYKNRPHIFCFHYEN